MFKLRNILVVLVLIMFVSCQSLSDDSLDENRSVVHIDSDSLMNKGKELASLTGKTLKSDLVASMQRGGIDEAIKYCNVNAHPLTDSISKTKQVAIRRVAKKFRNPKNALDSTSQKVFSVMQNTIEAGEKAEAMLLLENGRQVFFAPIRLEGGCLSCHGSASQIGKENLEIIKQHYPNDMAIDFKPGELRGLWKIEF